MRCDHACLGPSNVSCLGKCGGPVKPACGLVIGCWLGPDACAHTDGVDYAAVDETARWIVTSSSELVGHAGKNTPFEVAVVETEDSGAVAQVLGAPDLDATWLAYEMVHDIPHIPDWWATSEGGAWYRSLEAVDSDALLEVINAAVVFAAGLFVVSTRRLAWGQTLGQAVPGIDAVLRCRAKDVQCIIHQHDQCWRRMQLSSWARQSGPASMPAIAWPSV